MTAARRASTRRLLRLLDLVRGGEDRRRVLGDRELLAAAVEDAAADPGHGHGRRLLAARAGAELAALDRLQPGGAERSRRRRRARRRRRGARLVARSASRGAHLMPLRGPLRRWPSGRRRGLGLGATVAGRRPGTGRRRVTWAPGRRSRARPRPVDRRDRGRIGRQRSARVLGARRRQRRVGEGRRRSAGRRAPRSRRRRAAWRPRRHRRRAPSGSRIAFGGGVSGPGRRPAAWILSEELRLAIGALSTVFSCSSSSIFAALALLEALRLESPRR